MTLHAAHKLALRALPLLLLSSWLCASCSEADFGAPCALPDSEVVQAACSTDDPNEKQASCVLENIIQCDSRICGVYVGSNGFCTAACAADADCPGDAFCAEFVVGTGEKYCVPAELQGR